MCRLFAELSIRVGLLRRPEEAWAGWAAAGLSGCHLARSRPQPLGKEKAERRELGSASGGPWRALGKWGTLPATLPHQLDRKQACGGPPPGLPSPAWALARKEQGLSGGLDGPLLPVQILCPPLSGLRLRGLVLPESSE